MNFMIFSRDLLRNFGILTNFANFRIFFSWNWGTNFASVNCNGWTYLSFFGNWLMNFVISFHETGNLTSWWISWAFSYKRLTNFVICYRRRLTGYTLFSTQENDKICNIFLQSNVKIYDFFPWLFIKFGNIFLTDWWIPRFYLPTDWPYSCLLFFSVSQRNFSYFCPQLTTKFW